MPRSYDSVVVGSGLNALGAVRALGKAGLRVGLVSRERRCAAGLSRYAEEHLVIPDWDLSAPFIAESLNLGGHRPVLYLTEELDVAACLRDVNAWEQNFITYFFTPGIAAELMSKSRFHMLATQVKARVPRTWIVTDIENLRGLSDARFPLAVKPAVRDPSYAVRFLRGYKADTVAGLETLVSSLLTSSSELVVQEWIHGSNSDLYFNFVFVNAAGDLAASFVGRKVLCWPPDMGGTASCVAAPEHHDELTEYSTRFMRKVGLRGLLGIEYKRDTCDGDFYMVEPTVYRTDHQHEVAEVNGCSFLATVQAACKGHQLEPAKSYRNSRRWTEFPAARYAAKIMPPELVVTAGARRIDAHFRWEDPVPGVAHHAATAMGWLAGKLRSRLLVRLLLAPAIFQRSLRMRAGDRFRRRSVGSVKDHLKAAADWLLAAQAATPDAGVSHSYDALRSNWYPSYPETTGYAIETLYAYSDFCGQRKFAEAARRAADWEIEVALPSGAVMAGMVDARPVVPSVFNTGQVIFGWVAAAEREPAKDRYTRAAERAANWLLEMMDDDGAWRRHASPFCAPGEHSYNARTAFALARAAQLFGASRYLDASVRNIESVIRRAAANAFLPDNCLDDHSRPLVHTIAYAMRGILEVGLAAGRQDFVEIATRIAKAVARAQHLDGGIPGRLDANWRPAARWVCVTGNSQMALNWLRMHDANITDEFIDNAVAANRFVMALQSRKSTDSGIRGGIQGSSPIDAEYMSFRYPNWAAKFFMDALMLEYKLAHASSLRRRAVAQ